VAEFAGESESPRQVRKKRQGKKGRRNGFHIFHTKDNLSYGWY